VRLPLRPDGMWLVKAVHMVPASAGTNADWQSYDAHRALGTGSHAVVLGIYLLSRRVRSVLLQVSAFTIAHSITLGLSMYGVSTFHPRSSSP
jgi:hypothetical protein